MIPRALLVSEAWRKATKEQRLAIVDLCCRVAYSEHKYELNGVTIEVGKGQMAVTQSMLAKEWGMTRGQLRWTLSYLEKWGIITCKNHNQGNNQFTLLTLCMLAGVNNQANNQHTEEYNTEEYLKEKNIKKEKRDSFVPPTAEEVQQYLDEKGITMFTGREFVDYYSQGGWVYGRHHTPVRSWKACITTWIKNGKKSMSNGNTTTNIFTNGQAGREQRMRVYEEHIIRQLTGEIPVPEPDELFSF